MLILNLQEINYIKDGIVASPHLKSTQLQARKTKEKARELQASLCTPSSHGRPEKQRNKAQKEPSKMGNKGERFRKDPTTKSRKESQNGGLTDSPKLQTSSPQI